MHPGRLIAMAGALALVAATMPSASADTAGVRPEIGSVHTGMVAIRTKQVPLPEGQWVVAGLARNDTRSAHAGAYGAIESAILVRVAGTRIDAIAEINTNALAVTDGWGTTTPCKGDEALAKLTLYRTRADNLCLFVKRTDIGAPDVLAPASWIAAQASLRERRLSHGDTWLTVGLRASDRLDVLDVRYHFDDAAAGLPPGALADAKAWAEAERVDAARRRHLDAMVVWAAGIAEPIELGLHGRLSGSGRKIAPLGETLAAHGNGNSDTESAATDLRRIAVATGRGGVRSRAEALAAIADSGQITAEERQAYEKVIAETPLPVTDEDYFRTLVKKTISYNFFRVSVDFALAFIVTVSAAVSGYITAAIVATHSVAQIANDMVWDSYLAGVQNTGSDVVDFRQLGDRIQAVAS